MRIRTDCRKLGKLLRALRGTHPRTNFAKLFGVKPSTLARWEEGRGRPDLFFLVRLPAQTRTPLDYLLRDIFERVAMETGGTDTSGPAQTTEVNPHV